METAGGDAGGGGLGPVEVTCQVFHTSRRLTCLQEEENVE